MKPVIGFAGLTHLGLISALAAAAKGFAVKGYDSDASRVAEIAAGRFPVSEPGLDELASSAGERITYSSSPADLRACDIVYISTDVPTDDKGTSDLAGIVALIEQVSAALSPKALLVVLCQVPPGFTRRLSVPSERLYYQVETLIFGAAVQRATEPERLIIGCAEPARALPAVYQEFLSAFGCPIMPMRYESAELCKISINCCLIASVTVANTLAGISESIGADWSEIVPALRLDRRIGPYSYLKPGLGIAGGNLERDISTVQRLAEATGNEATLLDAFLASSAHSRDWALRVLHRHVLAAKPDACLAVWGLAYKENTHSTKNSPALALIASLGPWPVQVFDPVVPASAAVHPALKAASSAIAAARGADALLIMTPWPEFRDIAVCDLATAMKGDIIIDPYGALAPAAVRATGLRHFVRGVH